MMTDESNMSGRPKRSCSKPDGYYKKMMNFPKIVEDREVKLKWKATDVFDIEVRKKELSSCLISVRGMCVTF